LLNSVSISNISVNPVPVHAHHGTVVEPSSGIPEGTVAKNAEMEAHRQSLEAQRREQEKLSMYKHCEGHALKIEDLTAKTAVFEMAIGLLSMLGEGKFSGDNFMYIVNSAEEFLANKTRSMPEPLKEFMLKGARVIGLKVGEPNEHPSKVFAENEDKIMATYVRGFSIMGVITSFFAHSSSQDIKNKGEHSSQSLFSSLIMLVPALPMLMTYVAKHRLAEIMEKAKPEDPYTNKLRLNANEDLGCFFEALTLGTRKLLSQALPKQRHLIESLSGVVSSALGILNANVTLKARSSSDESANEEANPGFAEKLFKSKLMTETVPHLLYPAVHKMSKFFKLDLPMHEDMLALHRMLSKA